MVQVKLFVFGGSTLVDDHTVGEIHIGDLQEGAFPVF